MMKSEPVQLHAKNLNIVSRLFTQKSKHQKQLNSTIVLKETTVKYCKISLHFQKITQVGQNGSGRYSLSVWNE